MVKKYNRMAIILTEYELVHYRSWAQMVDSTCNNLQVHTLLYVLCVCVFTMNHCMYVMKVPLLLRSPDGEYVANLHSSITTMVEEAKWMQRLEFKIPEALHNVTIANVKKTYSRLAVCQLIPISKILLCSMILISSF